MPDNHPKKKGDASSGKTATADDATHKEHHTVAVARKHSHQMLVRKLQTDPSWEAQLKINIGQLYRHTSIVVLDAGGNISQVCTLRNAGKILYSQEAAGYTAGFYQVILARRPDDTGLHMEELTTRDENRSVKKLYAKIIFN